MAGEYQESGIPFLRSLNITPFRLSSRELKFIDRKFHERLSKSALKPGDVAVVRTGYPGTACVIPKDLGEANCSDLVLITPGPELNPYFLAAIFNSTFGRELVGGNLVGAAQQHFNITTAKELKLLMPLKATQDKIAAILTAYDDLIEVNKRRIALLEKMAEELYREWFVRMRVPGHQNTKFVKGVPVGWVTTRFSSICKFIKGKTPSELTLAPSEEHLPYVNAAYLRGQEAEFAKRDRGCVICNDGDTLMLMDGSNSGLVFRAKHGIVASTFARISMHEKHAHYIFEFLGASRDSILSNNTGSAVPHANKEFINRLIIYLPSSDQLLSDFNGKYEAIFQQKNILKQQTKNLTRTRDLLLPRLISGKLSVEDLDIQFPPSMRENP